MATAGMSKHKYVETETVRTEAHRTAADILDVGIVRFASSYTIKARARCFMDSSTNVDG